MTAPLIEEYTAGLRRRLPAGLAEEAAAGLIETYERGLAGGAGEEAAAREAVAEFGEQELVICEFTRQAPGRRAARLLLATGPAAGSCWAAALITSRAWTWPVPGARLAIGAVLLATVLALLAAATSKRDYRRTRLTTLAGPVILVLDAAAVTAVAAAAPAMTWLLGAAVAVSMARIAFTALTLTRMAGR
jgi:hypothetical protein